MQFKCQLHHKYEEQCKVGLKRCRRAFENILEDPESFSGLKTYS